MTRSTRPVSPPVDDEILRSIIQAGFRAFPASLLDPLISFATDWPQSHPVTLEESEDLVSAFARTRFYAFHAQYRRHLVRAAKHIRYYDSPQLSDQHYNKLARRQLEQTLNYMVEALVNSWTGGSPSTSSRARTLSPTSTPHKKITRMPPTMMVWKLANSDNYFSIDERSKRQPVFLAPDNPIRTRPAEDFWRLRAQVVRKRKRERREAHLRREGVFGEDFDSSESEDMSDSDDQQMKRINLQAPFTPSGRTHRASSPTPEQRVMSAKLHTKRFQDHASSNVKNISLSVIQPPPDVSTPSVTRSPVTAGRCTRKPRHSVLRRQLVATADGQSQLPTRLSRTPKVSGTHISEEGVCHESLHSQRSLEERWTFHCTNNVSPPDGTHINMSSEVVSARVRLQGLDPLLKLTTPDPERRRIVSLGHFPLTPTALASSPSTRDPPCQAKKQPLPGIPPLPLRSADLALKIPAQIESLSASPSPPSPLYYSTMACLSFPSQSPQRDLPVYSTIAAAAMTYETHVKVRFVKSQRGELAEVNSRRAPLGKEAVLPHPLMPRPFRIPSRTCASTTAAGTSVDQWK